jgi:2-haloalkanoic acid dehalogenase type II
MKPLAGPTPASLGAYIGDKHRRGNSSRKAANGHWSAPMTLKPLAGVAACVFDAYGTLFDFSAAARGCSDALGDSAAPLSALWRDKQLQYTWLLAAQNRHADFHQVTGWALDFALETLGVQGAGLRERLMSRAMAPDAFPEVPGVLRRLKAAGLRLAILSNGAPAMLAAAIEGAGLGGLFEAVLSVEEVGVYKPHPASTSLPWNASICQRRGSPFSRRTPGTPMLRLHSECRSSGATEPVSAANGFRERPIGRWPAFWSCLLSSARLNSPRSWPSTQARGAE